MNNIIYISFIFTRRRIVLSSVTKEKHYALIDEVDNCC